MYIATELWGNPAGLGPSFYSRIDPHSKSGLSLQSIRDNFPGYHYGKWVLDSPESCYLLLKSYHEEGMDAETLRYEADLEMIIARDPLISLFYAAEIIKGPFIEGEAGISTDPRLSILYAEVIGWRFYLGEEAISENPLCSLEYHRRIISIFEGNSSRFLQGENSILTCKNLSYDYMLRLGNIPPDLVDSFEEVFSTCPQLSYNYSTYTNREFPMGEKAISTDYNLSYLYATFKGGRFEAGEPIIATHGGKSLDYARYILKGRFEAGEPSIMSQGKENRKTYLDFLSSLRKVSE